MKKITKFGRCLMAKSKGAPSDGGSINTTSGTRNTGPGGSAGQPAQAGLDDNAILNEDSSGQVQPDGLSPESAPSTVGEAHGAKIGGGPTNRDSGLPQEVNPEASHGQSPRLSDVGPTAHQTQDLDTKSKAEDILVLTWDGIGMLLEKVEGFLEGTPAKTPVAILTVLIDTINAVRDNKDSIEELIILTATRLLVVDEAMNQGVPDSAKPRMTAFAKILQIEIRKLKKLSEKGLFRQVLQNAADRKAIEDGLKQVNDATTTFQLGLALANERKLEDIHSQVKLQELKKYHAQEAIYYENLDKVTLTRKACTEGTRLEILHDITTWADDTSVDCPPIYWLTGDAGSGKTTIAYTIAEHFEKLDRDEHTTGQHATLGASFHCSHYYEKTRKQVYIVPTIAYELAQKSRSYCHALHNADKFNSVGKLDWQIEDLLASPWQKSASHRQIGFPNYLIIVDALDEIEHQGGPKFLENMLNIIEQQHLKGLKFLFTSRPAKSITDHFDSSLSKTIYRLQDVPIKDVAEDIFKFLKTELPKFTDKELESMVALANGLFISAATIVRHLKSHDFIEISQQKILLAKLSDGQSFSGNSGLLIDEIYQRILHDALVPFAKDLPDSCLLILHTFLCTVQPVSTSVTAALTSQPETLVTAILESLYAVLHYKDGQVLWFHASFPDFIFSQTRSRFIMNGHNLDMYCNKLHLHLHLTMSCFNIMKSLEFNMGDISSSFLLDSEDEKLKERVAANIPEHLKYACCHWADHLAQVDGENMHDVIAQLADFLNVRILFWIEAMNLLGSSGQCSAMLQHAREQILMKTSGETELAANIAEAANFARYFTANPPVLSTPHLYISSLASWSTGSSMCQQWKKNFPGIPEYTHNKATNAPLMRIPQGSGTNAVAFSTNGTCIVSGSDNALVRVWDAATGHIINLSNMGSHRGRVQSVAFSSKSNYIASGSDDTFVRLWNASDGSQIHQLKGHTKSVNSVAFSHDDTYIVSGSNDLSVRVWDRLHGVAIKVLSDHTNWVRSVAISPKSTYLASGSDDRSVHIWNISTWSRTYVLKDHKASVRSVAFSANSTYMASGSDDESVCIWNPSSGQKIRVLTGHTNSVTSVSFSHDGTYIVSGSNDKSVRVWNTLTGDKINVFYGHKSNIRSVAFSPDSTCIVSGSDDKYVHVWDASSRAQTRILSGHTSMVYALAFSPDGSYIVSGSTDRSVKVWNALTGAQIKQLEGYTIQPNSLSFSLDGNKIAFGKYSGHVVVWDISTAEIKQFEGHIECVNTTAFSPNGNCIVSGSNDQSIRAWNTSNGEKIKALYSHTSRIESVAFSPDGTKLVSGSSWDAYIHIWDALSWAQINVIKASGRSVAFSPDSTQIVSCSHSHNILHVWDALSGDQIKALELKDGHSWGMGSVAYSLDGTCIVSGMHKSAMMWNVSTGDQIKVFHGHIDKVRSVAFSPDGHYIASGSEDYSIVLWNASTSDAQICTWIKKPNNWLYSTDSKHRLMWVPETPQPYAISVMSKRESAVLKFHDHTVGPDWSNCYFKLFK